MRFGGLNPFPHRFGGVDSPVPAIVASLNDARGTAYDTTQPSTVYAVDVALAFALAAVWSGNARVANQTDPSRVSDMLARWERCFGVTPATSDAPAARRARLLSRFRALAGPTDASLNDTCARLLGELFVGIEYTPASGAVTHWSATGEPSLWYSSVAHILVRVKRVDNTPESTFFRRVGQLAEAMQNILPAWVTWDWAVFGDNGAAGFFLDQRNLDQQAFDS